MPASLTGMVHTTDSRHDQPIAPNRLARTFAVDAPNRVWLAHITYLPTQEGWSMQPTLERSVVLSALRHALGPRRPQPGLVYHSDRGSQYATSDYQALLHRFHLYASMSRPGNRWDNAPMESFFATLKAELPLTVFVSHAAARSAVFDYIERFYNPGHAPAAPTTSFTAVRVRNVFLSEHPSACQRVFEWFVRPEPIHGVVRLQIADPADRIMQCPKVVPDLDRIIQGQQGNCFFDRQPVVRIR